MEKVQLDFPDNIFRLEMDLPHPAQIAWVNVLTNDENKVRGFSVLFEYPAMFVNFEYKKEGGKSYTHSLWN